MTVPLVLLHGFTGNPASWGPVIEHLPTARAIFRPALLGHEPESPPPRPSPRSAGGGGDSAHGAAFAAEVDRLAALLPAGYVDLCGYSLGARLALGLLARHGDRVRRAILVGVHAGLADEASRAARRAADARWIDLLERAGIAAFADAWEAQPLFATRARLPPAVTAASRAARRAHDPAGLALALRTLGLAEMPDLAPAVVAAAPHVHLVAGALDAAGSARAERLHRDAPATRLTIVPGAGHDVPLEDPAALGRVIALKEVAPS